MIILHSWLHAGAYDYVVLDWVCKKKQLKLVLINFFNQYLIFLPVFNILLSTVIIPFGMFFMDRPRIGVQIL